MVFALAVIAGFPPDRTLCLCCFMWLAAKLHSLRTWGPSFCWGLTALFCFFWCCASILSIGYPSLGGLVSFLPREVISQVRQMSVAFFKSRFDSWSNNSCRLLETLKTILSLIICSFSLKLPEAAQEYNSVRDTSKGSWNGMFHKKTLEDFILLLVTVLFKLFEDLCWVMFVIIGFKVEMIIDFENLCSSPM